MVPFGSTTGSFSLPMMVWKGDTLDCLSAMTFFIITPSPSSVPRMMTQPGKTLALLLCMVIIPCVLMLLSYFLYKKHYRLDEDEYERICGEIAVRKGETI